VPSDREEVIGDENNETLLIWVITLPIAVLVAAAVVFLLYRRKKLAKSRMRKREISTHKGTIQEERQQNQMLKAQLEEFQNSVLNIVVAVRAFDAGCTHGRENARVAQASRVLHLDADEVKLEPRVSAVWYWKEDKGRLASHPADQIKPGTEWVKWDPATAAELEASYQAWAQGANQDTVQVDISRGGASKRHAAASGTTFNINVKDMTQTNITTQYQRPILRDEVPTDGGGEESSDQQPMLGGLFARPSPLQLTDQTQVSQSGDKVAWPHDLDTSEDLLPMRKGQLIQVSRKRDDGWWFGTVVFDPNSDTSATQKVQKVDVSSGWFYAPGFTDRPSKEQHRAFNESLGGGSSALDALQPPKEWAAMENQQGCTLSAQLTDQERKAVTESFMRTLIDPSSKYYKYKHVKIVSIERVQNLALWQSYAAKLQTFKIRDHMKTNTRFEKTWLFHGSDPETMPKIMAQGFNRSFCGKNACRYGKGVYFARDSGYSVGYAAADGNGVRRMFLCRVLCGEYCLGYNNQLIPEIRDASRNLLYDSTVDDVGNPAIYVTYHDAQAYPEYVVGYTF